MLEIETSFMINLCTEDVDLYSVMWLYDWKTKCCFFSFEHIWTHQI